MRMARPPGSQSCAKVPPRWIGTQAIATRGFMVVLVDERTEHRDDVKALHRAVFGSEYEAELVDRLDRDGLVVASLVALAGDVVVGHVLFSDLVVESDGRPISAA